MKQLHSSSFLIRFAFAHHTFKVLFPFLTTCVFVCVISFQKERNAVKTKNKKRKARKERKKSLNNKLKKILFFKLINKNENEKKIIFSFHISLSIFSIVLNKTNNKTKQSCLTNNNNNLQLR